MNIQQIVAETGLNVESAQIYASKINKIGIKN